MIGIYESETEAKKAIDRLKDLPGFKEHITGFLIETYKLNEDHWTEGFTTVYPREKRTNSEPIASGDPEHRGDFSKD